MKVLLTYFAHIGEDPSDEPPLALKKTMLVFSSMLMASLAVGWAFTYWVFGEPIAASIPGSYALLSFLSIAYFARTRRYYFFRFSQLLLPLLLPFFLQISLGGFINGSAVVIWSLSCPVGAVLFTNRRQASWWFIAFLSLVAVCAALEPWLRDTNNLPAAVVTVFFVMNIFGISMMVFMLISYFLGQKNSLLRALEDEQDKSERLLLNILPVRIAALLKVGRQTIAEHHQNASVLFADVVDFTPMSAEMSPHELVEVLNAVFSEFDRLTEKYGLEKIKTIGDCYMVAAGVPEPDPDHAHKLIRMALDVREQTGSRRYMGNQLAFRIGINSGPVVAGVIGRKKFIYDLWGDAVNTASRMESHGEGGSIRITRSTWELIQDDFVCDALGEIDVKGKGPMEVWDVLAAR